MFWSASTLLSGLIDNFYLLYVWRAMLGIFEAPFSPSAYSIIADYFPPEKRGTANSFYNGAIYLGGALSSLSVVLINAVGWKITFAMIGIIGIGCGFLALFIVREPERGRFDVAKAAVVSAPTEKKSFGTRMVEII